MKRWLCCLGLLALLCWSGLGHARVARFAVVVGANMAPPGRLPLRYAHADAKAVARVLTSVGEFPTDAVEVLLEPTPERALSALDAALGRVASSDESLVLFYYSGHSDNAALYPSGEPLLLADLQRRLDDTRVSVRLGVLDSCRGGAWTGAKGLQAAQPFDISPAVALGNVGSALIASSSGLEDAHESELLGGSFFTHHFNAGLRGAADDNRDARVTLVEAFEYAKALTIRDTALLASTPQHPSFRMQLHGRQDLPLTNLSRGESWMALEQREGPLQVVHLGSGMLLMELPPGARAMRVALPPGNYLVRRRAGSHTYAKEYQVPAGELTKVAEADLELLGEARLAVKGTDLEEGRINWYSFGALGSYRGLGYSLSESQYGRIAPDGTSLTSFAGFAMVNTGLGVEAGLEVSLPGRVGWRVGRGSGFEWMPWVGFPYYWHGPSDDDQMLRVGVSVGLDAWADLSGRSRLGLNLGASSNEWGEANRFDVWAAAGHGFARGDHWRIHIGLGFAHTVADLAATASLADQRDRISLGGVLTDGVLPLPLVEFRADESLSFGLTAQLDFRLPDADFGYQATLGWTWRFVSDDTMPEQ